MSLVGWSVVSCGACLTHFVRWILRLLPIGGVIRCHVGTLRGSFVHLYGPLGASPGVILELCGVICALLWREGCHKGSDEGKCGRVVPMEVLEHRKHT